MSEAETRYSRVGKQRAWFGPAWGALLLLMVTAPTTSWAYLITSVNGCASYRCGDGTVLGCFKSAGSYFSYQVDCPNDWYAGALACADYGGLTGMTSSGGREMADYLGKLELASMACPTCVPGTNTPRSYARWVGICGSQNPTSLTCSETDATCFSKQESFKRSCGNPKELSLFWNIRFDSGSR